MRILRRMLSVQISLLLLLSITGCWNYTEVDDMAIVAGVAIDKNKEDGKLQLTAEIVDTTGGKDRNQSGFRMLSLSGDTMFEIVRNMISLTGKKLFWSHSKSIIVSKEIARDGLIKALDWYSRDTETRSDVFIFVSGEKTAHEVLDLNKATQTVLSFELAQMMRDEKHVGSAPVVEIWDFIDKLETVGKSAIAPIISIHDENGKKTERVDGTAIFKKDRMVGSLNGDETKSALFVKNKIQGGVLEVGNKDGIPSYSLEILGSRTKLKPRIVEGKVLMQIHTDTQVGLDEVMTHEGFQKDETTQDIEARASEQLQTNILAVIHKVQQEYGADIFGFGEVIHAYHPKLWAEIKGQWPEEFVQVDVTVRSKVTIESSAKTKRAIKRGD